MSTQTSAPEGTPQRTQPETFRGRSLAASLTANDIEKSLAWYRDVVGFTVKEQHEQDGKLVHVSLVAGGVSLMLGQDDGAKGWDRKKGEGFSFYITTAQDIDELAAGIVERGGSLASEPADMPWGARVFSLVDPDGFKLTISTAE